MQLTEHFFKSEFDSKDGSEMPVEFLKNIQELAFNLQNLRYYIKRPIIVTSGYRSEHYNDVVLPSYGYKTSKNSYHKLGKASDIVVQNLTPKQLATKIKQLISAGCMSKGGIGLYNGFVHYDIRGYNARWDKSSWYNFF